MNYFKWIEDISKFDESFINSHNDKNDEGHFFEFKAQYSEKLHSLHNDLPFLPERMKTEKVKKLIANLHNKTEYVHYISFEESSYSNQI